MMVNERLVLPRPADRFQTMKGRDHVQPDAGEP
jgi:hypothetical protein